MVGQHLVICSGPIAVGKSTIIQALIQHHGFRKLGSGSYLTTAAQDRGILPTRLNLVELGDRLDEETDFSWVVDRVAIPIMSENPEHSRWVFDSVRKRKQVKHFRESLQRAVLHVHFIASDDILGSRYEARRRESDITTPYHAAIDTDNERESRSLIELADFVIDVGEHGPTEVVGRVIKEYLVWSKSF